MTDKPVRAPEHVRAPLSVHPEDAFHPVRQQRVSMRSSNVVAVFTVATLALGWGCSRTNDRLGLEIGQRPAQFGGADAGFDAEAGVTHDLVTYCPSNKCPPGWTTCPTSRFPCDVNLRLD